MKEVDLKAIEQLYEQFNQSKINQKGYILLPTSEGFSLFEIEKHRLEEYLHLEAMHRKLESEIG